MPYKSQTTGLRIPKKHDKRIKLTDKQRVEIRESYLAGGTSQRKLAEQYGVSRRLIVFIIYPERQEANYKQRLAKGGSKQYYNKEKHTIAMKTHRRHKQKLFLKGELENVC